MNMRLVWNSCVLVAVSTTIAFAQQPAEQRGTNTRASQAQSSAVTMNGCVVRQRDWNARRANNGTPGGGTLAATNAGAAPTGSAAAGSVNRGASSDELLLIATASRPETSPRSAVPGSAPLGNDSGTVPSETRAGKSSPAQSGVPNAFRLSLAGGADASSYVGQRVEVTGRVTSQERAVPTDGGDVTRSGAATTGTRAEVARDLDAHPSTDLPELTVQTIKPVAGQCEMP